MTADYRVTAAREFLDVITPYPVATRLPSVLVREDAELRRLLASLLTLTDDYADEDQREDTTHLTVSGGAHITPAGTLVLGQALADAVTWREYGDDCTGCTAAASGVCDDHAADAERAAAYVALGAELGIDVGKGCFPAHRPGCMNPECDGCGQ